MDPNCDVPARIVVLFCQALFCFYKNGGMADCLAEWRENCCWQSVEAAATGTRHLTIVFLGDYRRKQERPVTVRREPPLPCAPAALSLNQVSPLAKSHVPLPRTSPDPSDVDRGHPLAKQGQHTQGTPDTGPRGQFSTSSSA